jgi:hypothetical protein
MSSNRRRNNVGENIDHITQPPNRQQQAQNTREKGRPEKKVTEFDAMKAEEPDGATANGANRAPIMSRYKKPAILDLKCGDASAIRSIFFMASRWDHCYVVSPISETPLTPGKFCKGRSQEKTHYFKPSGNAKRAMRRFRHSHR